MKTNLAYFAGAAGMLCCLSLRAFCDPAQPENPPQVPNAILPGKPAISSGSTSVDLNKYVQYLRQQGYQVLDRQQHMNGRGTVVSFQLRAARPAGSPTADSPRSFVKVNGDYRKMVETITVYNKKTVNKVVKREPTDPKKTATEASVVKPPLSTHASKSDLEKYVQYFRRQGYIVTERQEKFKENGSLLLFRFHAVQNSGTLSGPICFVDALITPYNASDTIYSGPTFTFKPASSSN